MHNINLRMVYALLVTLKNGNATCKTELLNKASVAYGKCIGSRTMTSYLTLLENKGLVVVGDGKIDLSVRGVELFDNITQVANDLGFEDEEE